MRWFSAAALTVFALARVDVAEASCVGPNIPCPCTLSDNGSQPVRAFVLSADAGAGMARLRPAGAPAPGRPSPTAAAPRTRIAAPRLAPPRVAMDVRAGLIHTAGG